MSKKRVMWWNLPPEEIDELRDAGQLNHLLALSMMIMKKKQKERKADE